MGDFKDLKVYAKAFDLAMAIFEITKIEIVTEESLSPYFGPRIKKEVEYATL